MFCEKWKRIREASSEKCISYRKYVVHSFLCVKHLLPSSVQLHKGEFYSSTALYKRRKKTRTQDNFGSYLGLSTCQFFSSPCDNCHKKSFAITVSFSLLFVTFEHNVNRLEQNMSPNMSYFKLKLSNLELHEFLFQNCQLYFTSFQLRLQKLLPPYNTYSA